MAEVEILSMENRQVEARRYTAEEMLANVDHAILTIMNGGQSYKIGSRALTRADLATLNKMRAELQAEVAQGRGSSLLDNCYVAVFSGR